MRKWIFWPDENKVDAVQGVYIREETPTASTAGRELQQHRVHGERERFKRTTDELRKLQGKPAWRWRD